VTLRSTHFGIIRQNSRISQTTRGGNGCIREKKKGKNDGDGGESTLQRRFIFGSVARTKLTESFKGARKPTISGSFALNRGISRFLSSPLFPPPPPPRPYLAVPALARRQNTRLVSRDAAKKTLTKYPPPVIPPWIPASPGLTNEDPRAPTVAPFARRRNGVGSAACDVTRADRRYTYAEIGARRKAAPALEEK